jgi:hypothetical protein
MKKIILPLLLTAFASHVNAQTFEEWFKQKKTQKKYLLQQIAALEMYIGYVQKGYSIANKGLTMISDIKNGELNLHEALFNSLKSVNPNIKNDHKVADIISMQETIIQTYMRDYKRAKESHAFNENEINYINRVYSRLLDDCSNFIDELIKITTANQLEMKDDERLKRINILYNEMQDKYIFSKSLGNETMMLALSRAKENKDVQTSWALNSVINKHKFYFKSN